MPKDTIDVVEYSKTHAKSIAEDLFVGVPEDIVRNQREELLKPGPEEVFSVCAVSGTRVVGVCTGVRMRWFGSRHRIEIVQVVMDKEFRRKCITRLMMKMIAEHFAALEVEIVQISAESGNETAIVAYEHIGFQRFGVLRDGIKHEDNYSDEVMMAIPITNLL